MKTSTQMKTLTKMIKKSLRKCRSLAPVALVSALFASALIFADPRSAHALGGHETQNGGSIIVDGQEISLADLHFMPLPFDLYQFDPELKSEIQSIHDLLYDKLDIVFSRSGGYPAPPHDFFRDDIFNDRIEYRFVEKLPSDCTFIPPENLPYQKERINIACTRGSVTYILPQYFVKLGLLEKSLLIIHERLHAFAPQEPYDIKTDVIRAMSILKSKYEPALAAPSVDFAFTDDELKTLNLLNKRVRQLSSYSSKVPFIITAQGAIIFSSQPIQVSGKNIVLGLGTMIGISADQTHGIADMKGFTVEGDDIVLMGARILLFDWSSPCTIRGNSIRITGGETCQVQGDRIQMENSKISWVQGQDLKLTNSKASLRSKWEGEKEIYSPAIDGQGIELLDSELYSIVGKGIRVQNSKYVEIPGGEGIEISDLNADSSTDQRLYRINVSVQGRGIHLSKLGFYCRSYCDKSGGVATIRGGEISLKDVRVDLDVIQTVYDRYPNERYAGFTLEGDRISLERSKFGGAKISGSDIALSGVQLAPGVCPSYDYHKPICDRSSTLPVIQGQRIRLSDVVTTTGSLQLQGSDIHFERAKVPGALSYQSVQGFEVIDTDLSAMTLRGKSVRSVSLEKIGVLKAKSGSLKVEFLPNTTVKNIAEFVSESTSLSFGKAGSTVTLDGGGKSYLGRKGFFSDSVQVQSQGDLERDPLPFRVRGASLSGTGL